MDSLSTIQSVAQAQIAAHAFFSGRSVLVNDGRQRDAIEAALNTAGFVVIVDLPLSGVPTEQFQDVTIAEVTLPVRVVLNPEVDATTNLLDAVEAVHNALKAYSPTDEANRFTFDNEGFQLFTFDDGTVAFHLLFTKLTPLSETTE